jgi:hypothetical protein
LIEISTKPWIMMSKFCWSLLKFGRSYNTTYSLLCFQRWLGSRPREGAAEGEGNIYVVVVDVIVVVIVVAVVSAGKAYSLCCACLSYPPPAPPSPRVSPILYNAKSLSYTFHCGRILYTKKSTSYTILHYTILLYYRLLYYRLEYYELYSLEMYRKVWRCIEMFIKL